MKQLMPKAKKVSVTFKKFLKDKILFGIVLFTLMFLSAASKLGAYDVVFRENTGGGFYMDKGIDCPKLSPWARPTKLGGQTYWEMVCFRPITFTYIFAPLFTLIPFYSSGVGKLGDLQRLLTSEFSVWFYNGIYIYTIAVILTFYVQKLLDRFKK